MHALLSHTIVVMHSHLHTPYLVIVKAPPPTLLQHYTRTPPCTTLLNFIAQDFVSQIAATRLHCALNHASNLLDLIIAT
jgi:hypothetical protein